MIPNRDGKENKGANVPPASAWRPRRGEAPRLGAHQPHISVPDALKGLTVCAETADTGAGGEQARGQRDTGAG